MGKWNCEVFFAGGAVWAGVHFIFLWFLLLSYRSFILVKGSVERKYWMNIWTLIIDKKPVRSTTALTLSPSFPFRLIRNRNRDLFGLFELLELHHLHQFYWTDKYHIRIDESPKRFTSNISFLGFQKLWIVQHLIITLVLAIDEEQGRIHGYKRF